MSRSSNQIKYFERDARKKYNSALKLLKNTKPANWFQHTFDKNLLPPLSLIGFDKQLSQSLFQIALPSWQEMGPSIDDCLWIHPSLTKNIEEIRKDFLKKTEEKQKTRSTVTDMNSRETYNHTKMSMAPENLTSILDEISTSWIILPRAYPLLRRKDGCCLISYLKVLKREKSPDFKKLIARIITEFIGNYSLKYASEQHSRQAVTEVIFYGYAAMFWKNIEQPPHGCEDLSIYKNFLHWIKAFQKRTSSMDNDMTRTIEKMTAMERDLFPPGRGQLTTDDKEINSERFLITLRHGQRGIETACRAFGVTENSLKHPSQNQYLLSSGPKAFTRLTRDIKKEYENETQKTKEMILVFTKQMKNAHDSNNNQHSHVQDESLKRFTFTGARLVNIIDDFIHSLQHQNPL